MSKLETALDKLTGWAHTLGKVARDTTAAARDIYHDLEPAISAALDAARTATDADRRKQAVSNFEAFVTRATASSSAYLQKTLGTLVEAFNGVPPSLAAQLAVYASVKEAAAAKGADKLREVCAADACVVEIRDATNAGAKDFTALQARFEPLVLAASKAVGEFSANEEDVRRLVISSGSTFDELSLVLAARDASVAELGATILGATADQLFDVGVVTELSTRRQSAVDAVAAGAFFDAALALHNWQVEAESAVSSIKADDVALRQRIGEPARLRGLLSALVARANEQGKLQGAAAEAAQAANAKVKARPCDVVEARAAVDAFEVLVR